MERIWAPWRSSFVRKTAHRSCIFCTKPKSRKDAASLILKRGHQTFSMLNLYPYTNGHILIAPYRHLADPRDLDPSEREEMFRMMDESLDALDGSMRPHGYNMGFNLGRTAGAGFEKHVHLHIVPRWNGDTNFMPVTAGVRVVPESLQSVRRRLLKCL